MIPNSSIVNKQTGRPILYNSTLNKWSQFNELVNYVITFNEAKHDKDTFIGIINDACEKLIGILESNEIENSKPNEGSGSLINKLKF